VARFQFSGPEHSKQPPIITSLDLRLWRVIGAEMCTLLEAQTVYNYTDILDMHEYLNIREHFEDLAQKKARKDSERVRNGR
jgi:hypothetical protein